MSQEFQPHNRLKFLNEGHSFHEIFIYCFSIDQIINYNKFAIKMEEADVGMEAGCNNSK